MGNYLHKNDTSLFCACHCVVEQPPLLVVAATDGSWPEHNDVVEFSVLGTVNSHPLPATNIVSARLVALGKRLLYQLHDLISGELYLRLGPTLNIKPFGYISGGSGVTSSGEYSSNGNTVRPIGQLDLGEVLGCSF